MISLSIHVNLVLCDNAHPFPDIHIISTHLYRYIYIWLDLQSSFQPKRSLSCIDSHGAQWIETLFGVGVGVALASVSPCKSQSGKWKWLNVALWVVYISCLVWDLELELLLFNIIFSITTTSLFFNFFMSCCHQPCPWNQQWTFLDYYDVILDDIIIIVVIII